MAAIYMWIESGIQLLTTTLYPVEVEDSVQLAGDIEPGVMWLNPSSDVNLDAPSFGVNLYNTLLTSTGTEDTLTFVEPSMGVTLYVALLDATVDVDTFYFAQPTMLATLVDKLVTVDTPDEKLQLNCDVVPGNCSMTHI